MYNNCLLLIFRDQYVGFHVSAMTQTIESAFNSIKGKLLEPNFISYIEDKILHKFVHETIKSNKFFLMAKTTKPPITRRLTAHRLIELFLMACHEVFHPR